MSRLAGIAPEPQRDVRTIDIRVEPFSAHHLPLVAAFSERYWSRPRTEAYYRWRYLESQPFSRLFLALGGDECLGMVCALRKPYLIAGQRTSCLEVFDWHCLPGLRGSGVGIRVMRAMMRTGERVISFGGTADVLSTLPAMGWQRMCSMRMFELPVSGSFLQAALRKRVPVRVPGERVLLDTAAFAWFRPRRRQKPEEGQAVPVSIVDGTVAPLYDGDTGYDVLQVPDTDLLRWVSTGYAGSGSFGFLYFTVKGRLRGWAMTRVYETAQGREADIFDVYAPRADVSLYTWMVSEAALSVAGARPRMIRARACCPVLQSAFRANRFTQGRIDIPVHTWPKTLHADLRPHVTLNHSDEPLRPYPLPGAAHGFPAD